MYLLIKVNRIFRQRVFKCLFCMSILFYFFLYNANKFLDIYSTFFYDHKIDCHYSTDGDALRSAEGDFSPPQGSIFFHETSCRGDLNPRQACAVESAAMAHPNRTVFVLFSGPVSKRTLTSSRSSLFQLRKYRNVRYARVHIDEYASGTALHILISNRYHHYSIWPVHHSSDLLRFLTMYKFGGLYLDTDLVILKSLDDLGRNWLVRESKTDMGSGAMDVAKDRVGREIIARVLDEVSTSYRPESWGYNGPKAMERVLAKFCNTSRVEEFSKNTCRGLNIYSHELNPVPYPEFRCIFAQGDVNFDGAYALHVWNKLSQSLEVQPDSPYDKLTKLHCPVIRQLYNSVKSFGKQDVIKI